MWKQTVWGCEVGGGLAMCCRGAVSRYCTYTKVKMDQPIALRAGVLPLEAAQAYDSTLPEGHP